MTRNETLMNRQNWGTEYGISIGFAERQNFGQVTSCACATKVSFSKVDFCATTSSIWYAA